MASWAKCVGKQITYNKAQKKMGKATTKRHLAALKQVENIISNAIKTGESDVDLTHNTNTKTLKHKQKVDKYIYFNTQVLINEQIYNVKLSAEQIKGQDPNVLDLYDVNIKKEPDTNLEQNDIVNQNVGQLFQGKKANGFYDPELGVIVLGRNMNEMTLPHEMQHYWLDNIFSIYKRAKSGE